MRKDQSNDLELDGPIKLRILDGIGLGTSPKRNDGDDEIPRNQAVAPQLSRKSGK